MARRQSRRSKTPISTNSGMFLTPAGCIGLNEREMSDDRLLQCPSLVVSIQEKDPAKILPSIRNIVDKVAQNKLSTLMGELAAQGQLLQSEGGGEDGPGGNKGRRKKPGESESLYDKNAEYRARLRALVSWMRGNRVYEGFDVRLPKLPMPKDKKWFVMNGPVYVFLRNHLGFENMDIKKPQNHTVVHVIFPSMAKDGMQILTYDNLGKSHLWINRILTYPSYATDIKENCSKPCAGQISKTGICGASVYPKEDDIKLDTKLWNYNVYKVNEDYFPISKYFANSYIKGLTFSILPSDWDMFAVQVPPIIIKSDNNVWTMMLAPIGLIISQYNMPKYSIRVRDGQIAKRMVLEGNILTIYGISTMLKADEDNEVLWSLELIKDGVPPYSLHLQDDGQLVLYDGNNGMHQMPHLYAAFSDSSNGNDSADYNSKYGRNQDISFDAYDPNDEYKRRLMQLMEWMRVRGLMQRFIPDIPKVVKYIEFEFEELGPNAPFDPAINYRTRLTELLSALHKNFPNITIPSDVEVNEILNNVSKPRPKYVSETGRVRDSPYDPSSVRADRIKQLGL